MKTAAIKIPQKEYFNGSQDINPMANIDPKY